MFMKSFKDSLKACAGNFDQPLKLFISQAVEGLSDLSDEDVIFLKRVIEKLKGKQVTATVWRQAQQKLELVEKRFGVRKLELRATSAAEEFQRVLQQVKDLRAEILHLKANRKPVIKSSGVLQELPGSVEFSSADLLEVLGDFVSPAFTSQLAHAHVVDFSLSIPGLSRFRVSAYYEGGQPALSLRQIPFEVPDTAEIGLEPQLQKCLEQTGGGIFVISGPAGSGKSTTVASILQHVSRQDSVRIVTLENPIEYLLRDNKGSVTQRELGSDLQSVMDGLRFVLKGGTHWLYVSEIKSAAELEALITAAESNIRVLVSLPSSSVSLALESLTALLQQEGQQSLIERFANTLKFSCCQHLMPQESKKLLAVREYLIADASTRTLVREMRWQGIIGQLDSLQSARSLHRRTFEHVVEGSLDFDSCLDYVEDRENFETRYRPQLKRLRDEGN